jgi:hypothetical protein
MKRCFYCDRPVRGRYCRACADLFGPESSPPATDWVSAIVSAIVIGAALAYWLISKP